MPHFKTRNLNREMNFNQTRENALDIFKEALETVNPKRCLLEHIKLNRDRKSVV